MILSLNEQAKIFLMSIILGLISGAVYDGIKIFRIAIKHNNIFVQIEDAIFWVAMAFFVFSVMLSRNFGEIRFFNIIGIFSGMTFYIFTISPIVVGFSEKIINVIKYVLRLFTTIILTPLRLLYIVIGKPIVKTSFVAKQRLGKVLHLVGFYAKIKSKGFYRSLKIIKNKK